MDYLTRDAILASQDIQVEQVEVPEWGGMVMVRGMSGTERDAFEDSLISKATGNRKQRRKEPTKLDLANVRAKLCAWCIVDEKNKRIFTDTDVAALGAKSAAALDKVFEVAQRLSGISDDDVEEMAGDMLGNPTDGSSSP